MDLDFLLLIKILAVVMVPVMVGVMWVLPRLLASKTRTKMIVGAIVVLVFMASLVVVTSGDSVNRDRFITVCAAIIGGFTSFLIGVYFDVQWRVKQGAKYYREFKLQRAYGFAYAVIGVVISLPLGIIFGWIISVWRDSLFGMIFSAIVGVIYGGLLGWILDQVVRRRAHSNRVS